MSASSRCRNECLRLSVPKVAKPSINEIDYPDDGKAQREALHGFLGKALNQPGAANGVEPADKVDDQGGPQDEGEPLNPLNLPLSPAISNHLTMMRQVTRCPQWVESGRLVRRLKRSAKQAHGDIPKLASLGAIDKSHALSAERVLWRKAQTDNVITKVHYNQLQPAALRSLS